MLRSITVFVTLTTVMAATDLHKFEGEWIHIAMYTAASETQTCTKFNITLDAKPCTCDGRPASALKFGLVPLPIIVVEDYNDVQRALGQKCTSGNIMKTMAVRLVNDNFFVAYEKCYECTDNEPNTANLMSKKMPTKLELENLQGIDELKARRGVTCNLVQ